MSKADPSLFNCQNNNKLERMGKEYNTAFHYLGLDLKEHRNYISLDQTHYIIKLKMKI